MDAKACLRSMRLRTLPLSLAGIILGMPMMVFIMALAAGLI